MNYKSIVLIILTCSLISTACRTVKAKAPEQLSDGNGLSWERVFYKDQLEPFNRADYAPGDEHFLTANDYRYIKSWEKPFKTPVGDFQLKEDHQLVSARFIGGHHDILLMYINGYAQILDNDLQLKKFEHDFECTSREDSAAINQDGRFIAACGKLYDLQRKKIVGRPGGHAVDKTTIFGDKKLLLTAGYHDQSIYVRDIYSGELERCRTPHPIKTASMSPNENYIAAITTKSRCYFWNWPDKKPKVLKLPKGYPLPIAFSPDSKWFAVFSPKSKYLHIFGSDPLTEISRVRLDESFGSMHVVTENLIFMCAKHQGFVYIYDISAKKMIARYRVFPGPVESLKFNPENGYLWVASGGNNLPQAKGSKPGTIALYRIKGIEKHIRANAP